MVNPVNNFHLNVVQQPADIDPLTAKLRDTVNGFLNHNLDLAEEEAEAAGVLLPADVIVTWEGEYQKLINPDYELPGEENVDFDAVLNDPQFPRVLGLAVGDPIPHTYLTALDTLVHFAHLARAPGDDQEIAIINMIKGQWLHLSDAIKAYLPIDGQALHVVTLMRTLSEEFNLVVPELPIMPNMLDLNQMDLG